MCFTLRRRSVVDWKDCCKRGIRLGLIKAYVRGCVLSQLSSSVLMATGASHKGRCAMGTATVRTDRMNWIVRLYPTAATSTVITKLAVSQKTSCVTVSETAPMARMRRSVVGDDGSHLKYHCQEFSIKLP